MHADDERSAAADGFQVADQPAELAFVEPVVVAGGAPAVFERSLADDGVVEHDEMHFSEVERIVVRADDLAVRALGDAVPLRVGDRRSDERSLSWLPGTWKTGEG